MTKQHLAMGAADANFSKEFTAEPVVDTPPSFDEGGALKMLKIISEKVRENKVKAAAAAQMEAGARVGSQAEAGSGTKNSQSSESESQESRVKRFASADAAVGEGGMRPCSTLGTACKPSRFRAAFNTYISFNNLASGGWRRERTRRRRGRGNKRRRRRRRRSAASDSGTDHRRRARS